MPSNKTRYKAILSVVIFLIIIVKDFLVSYLELIPERSKVNRTISWFVILPLAFVGFIFSIQVIKETCLAKAKKNKRFLTLNLCLSLPMLVWFLYFLGMLIYIFTL
jgi:hypothetical protein